MAPQGLRKNPGALDTETDTIVFDGGDGCLRNIRSFRQFILAQVLKLADNPNGFSDRHSDSLLCLTVCLHSQSPVIMRCHRFNVEG